MYIEMLHLDRAERARVAAGERRQAGGGRQRAARLLVLAGDPQAGQRDRLPGLGRAQGRDALRRHLRRARSGRASSATGAGSALG